MNVKISDKKNLRQKDWWKLVRQYLKKKGIYSDDIPPLDVNGHTLYTDKDKATAFNNFFTDQCTLENEDDPLPHLDYNYETQLTDIVLAQADIRNTILNLDTDKATGPDQIHNKLLIAAVDVLSTPLTDFFNRCLTASKFPNPWKLANVTPIFKKGDRGQCTNYRPISLLSCVGKLFERCVSKYVYNYLTENSIISKNQSGFTQGDSTVNQLLAIYDNIVKNYDKGIETQSVYFDISKAFDRVWHRGLLLKLEAIGIRGNLLNWFKDYLTDRSQCVVIKGEQSCYKSVLAGVPQGSVLGPTLFLVYINDIVNNLESLVKMFADDTKPTYQSRNFKF